YFHLDIFSLCRTWRYGAELTPLAVISRGADAPDRRGRPSGDALGGVGGAVGGVEPAIEAEISQTKQPDGGLTGRRARGDTTTSGRKRHYRRKGEVELVAGGLGDKSSIRDKRLANTRGHVLGVVFHGSQVEAGCEVAELTIDSGSSVLRTMTTRGKKYGDGESIDSFDSDATSPARSTYSWRRRGGGIFTRGEGVEEEGKEEGNEQQEERARRQPQLGGQSAGVWKGQDIELGSIQRASSFAGVSSVQRSDRLIGVGRTASAQGPISVSDGNPLVLLAPSATGHVFGALRDRGPKSVGRLVGGRTAASGRDEGAKIGGSTISTYDSKDRESIFAPDDDDKGIYLCRSGERWRQCRDAPIPEMVAYMPSGIPYPDALGRNRPRKPTASIRRARIVEVDSRP
ncbi:hypothetical protein THAOC_08291, partial [Thalassiosira oceanica]